jgi:hypothetical protein
METFMGIILEFVRENPGQSVTGPRGCLSDGTFQLSWTAASSPSRQAENGLYCLSTTIELEGIAS